MRNYYFFCEGCVKTLGLVTSEHTVGIGNCCSCYKIGGVFGFEAAIALRAGNDFVKRTRMDYIRLLTTEGVLRKFGMAMKRILKRPRPFTIEPYICKVCTEKPGNMAFFCSPASVDLGGRDLSVGLSHGKWVNSVPPEHYRIFSQILAAKIRKDPCSPFMLWLHIK